MDCVNKEKKMVNCNCTYEPCAKKGICCECIAYHRNRRELPGCYFDKAGEATWDRSIENFIRLNSK